jgi:tetratricopeptide (TPR) repeat protein
VRARQAYLAGRLHEAEALAMEALASGSGGPDESPTHTFAVQMLFIRREQNRLAEFVDAVAAYAAAFPSIAAWRCALALVYAELGREREARREFDALAEADFVDLPRDGLWLGAAAALAEIAVRLGDRRRAARLYELLTPFAGRCVVIAAAVCQGAAARPLGLLATALGDVDRAEAHFADALEINAGVGAELWLAHSRCDYARALAAHGDAAGARALRDEAWTAANRLGLAALAARMREEQ